MRRLIATALAALLAVAGPSSAQMLLTGAGGTKKIAAGAAYVGPGDVVSGAWFWGGLRAYNAAYATSLGNAVDLEDQSFGNPITIKVLANGKLDVASISAWVTAHSVTTINITQLYDQSGNGRNLTQAGTRCPTLVLGGLGSLPVINFNPSSITQLFVGPSVTLSQPFTMTGVAQTSISSSDAYIIGNNARNVFLEFSYHATQLLLLYAGTELPTANSTTDTNWHANFGVLNGASSTVQFDTTAAPGAAGAGGFAAETFGVGGSPAFGGGQGLTGNMTEAGIWSSALTSTNLTNLNSNQHTYWGF